MMVLLAVYIIYYTQVRCGDVIDDVVGVLFVVVFMIKARCLLLLLLILLLHTAAL